MKSDMDDPSQTYTTWRCSDFRRGLGNSAACSLPPSSWARQGSSVAVLEFTLPSLPKVAQTKAWVPGRRREHLIRTSEFQLQPCLCFASLSTPLWAPGERGVGASSVFLEVPSFTENPCVLCYRWVPPGVLFTPYLSLLKKSIHYFLLKYSLRFLSQAVLCVKSKVWCLLTVFLCWDR